MTESRPRIAIIGAGFSGLLTALHLLKAAPRATVRLIERGRDFGPGAAYAASNPEHVLNVRLNNMSAFPDQPDHLAQWLAGQSRWQAQDGFITRGVYGEYLKGLLEQAMADVQEGPRLELVRGEAVTLEPVAGGGWRVRFADHAPVEAEAAVLALGNMEPLTPPGLDPSLERSWRYVADPWRAVESLPDKAGRVLLIGSGLTMVDAAITLSGQGRKLTAISRRGLLPRAHAIGGRAAAGGSYTGSPTAVLRQARERMRREDWRAVIDDLRGSARPLWRSWSQDQRRRVLRHLRPVWEVHRHRLAPGVAHRVHGMIASGELSVLAGRIVSLKPDGDRVLLTWRPRGARRTATRRIDAVVNCTGPLGALDQSRSPLVRALLDGGVIRPDPNGLGARVDDRCRLIDDAGEGWRTLYAVGPLTRGAFWEITSVPDLRQQALDVARDIAAATGG